MSSLVKNSKISEGVVHPLAKDFQRALSADSVALAQWEDITPLARNEFICWVEDAKQASTRERRIKRACEDLSNGKRRPCCWMGCVHRQDKPLNPSQKWILDKKQTKS